MGTNPGRLWLLGLMIGSLVVASGIGRAQRVSEPEIWLRDALHKEQVEGDLAGAIKLYERIASEKQTPRAVAAQALLNLGRCHEKLGNRDAQKAYERIVQQFPDQGSTTAEARTRLAALRVPTGGRAAGITSTKLTTAERLYSRNVSADGRYVVASAAGGFGIVDLATGAVKRFPYDSGRRRGVVATVISPDGKRAAYSGTASDIRVINADGTGLRVLKVEGDYRAMMPLDWSPDGQTIAMFVVKRGPTDAPPASPELAMVDVATGRFHVLEPAFAGLAPTFQSGFVLVANLRFSPDGAHLAFTVRRWTRPELMRPVAAEEGDIYTIKADGTARERLAIGEEPAELAGWMPDGRGIAFVSERNGVRTMFAIPVDQGRARGNAVTLFRGVGWSVPLGISSAGSLTYAVDGRVLGSYIADLRDNPPVRTPITVPTGDWVIFPAWSPDERHLAFVAGLPQLPAASPFRLTIRDLATGDDRVVLQWNGALTRGTSWTADGKGLVISRVIGTGTFQIDRVDVATGAVQSLVPSIGMPVSSPRLTPDARHLYFLAAETRLMRVELATGQRTELIAIAEWFDLSRDGSQLAFVQSNGPAYVLKLQPTDGSPSRDLIRFGPQDRINSISFAPDGQSLVFAKAGDGPSELFRVSTTGQPNPLPLGVIVGQSFPDVSVHPDDRRLAFIDNEWSVDFWQMNGLAEAFAAAVRAPAPVASTQPATAPRAK